jgi:RHS repeat-associated protein
MGTKRRHPRSGILQALIDTHFQGAKELSIKRTAKVDKRINDMQNQHLTNRKFSKSCTTAVRFLLSATFLIALCVVATTQAQDGSSLPESRNSGNLADQNLKSLAHINPSTLALELEIPFANYPGRRGNNVGAALRYSSKLWRMDNEFTYFTTSPSGFRSYITLLRPIYAERSIAGWTSSLDFPMIEEKLDLYNQDGHPFSFGLDDVGINSLYQGLLDSNEKDDLENPGIESHCGCRYNFGYCDASCSICSGECDDWCEYTGNQAPGCPQGDGGGGPDSSPSPTPSGSPTPSPTPTPWPSPTPWPTPWPTPEPVVPPDTMHYVKRVNVRMPDGSVHEFRKSDAVFGYCNETGYDGPDCETLNPDKYGNFLSVDGTGMRLYRDLDGSTLYMPDGGRYFFGNSSDSEVDKTSIYTASKFIDADGNVETNTETQVDSEPFRVTTDTAGRVIQDILQVSKNGKQPDEGDQSIGLPGFNGQPLAYTLKWRHLKPITCDEKVMTNCGNSEGALDDQNQPLYFFTPRSCVGSEFDLVDPDPANPSQNLHSDQILFPLNSAGLRSCNPYTGNDSTGVTPLRFNPVVLSEVDLPNGQSYQLRYNQFGEISKIIYPGGSMETFTYASIRPLDAFQKTAYDQANRGVVERKVYSSSTATEPSQRWRYSVPASGPYIVTTEAPTKEDPLGNGVFTERYLIVGTDSEHLFGFNDPLAGMASEERSYSYQNGPLRSRTLIEWIKDGPSATNDPVRNAYIHASRDPRVTRQISITIENGQALATLKETAYETPGENNSSAPTDPSYFARLNVKQIKTHHFQNIPLTLAQTGTPEQIAAYFNSSTVAMISETDYLYDQNYKDRGISSLPIEARSIDPADLSVLSKTQTKYDNLLPNISTGYPQDYSSVNYGISNSFECGMAAPNTCWSDPGSAYHGHPTTARVWKKDTDTWIESYTEYDIFGNSVKAKDPIGNETSTLFEDSTAKPYKYVYPTQVTAPAPDPTGTTGTSETSTAQTKYDFTTGLPIEVTDDFGQVTTTEYNDPLLRPTRVNPVVVNGVATGPITETIYDDNARTVKVRKQLDANNWDEATTFMDTFGRATKTEAKDSQGDVFVETQYDVLGHVQMVSNPYRSGDAVYWSLTEYDELGRATQTRAPVANQDPANPTGDILGTTSYDLSISGDIGSVVTATDASGRKSRSITNALGQLIRVDEPTAISANANDDLGPIGSPVQKTTYKYDFYGKMVQVTQGVQNRYFKYDSLGRLIRVNQPEQDANANFDLADSFNTAGHWTAAFVYDDLGNVLRATDANGVNIINEYDKANRGTQRCYTKPNVNTTATTCAQIASGDVSADTPAVQFWYDGKGLATQQSPNFAKGKLTKVDNGISASLYMTFDNFGRLTRSQQITDGVTYGDDAHPMAYTYNLSGALTQETYPSGRVVKNDLESDGDLSRIYGKATASSTEHTYASDFRYMPDGRISQLRLGSGLWEEATFNTRLQVTELGLGHGVTGPDLWKLNYDYGEVDDIGNLDATKNTGNIGRQTLSFNGLAQPFVQTYKYDPLQRLKEAVETSGTGTSAPQVWKETYGYDRYGNRSSHSKFSLTNQLTATKITDPTIDQNTNRFDDGQDYSYDHNGNLIADVESRGFTFNADNKQTKVTQNGVAVGEYFFDGEGKRVKKVVYDPNGTGAVTEVTVFVYSTGKLIGEYSTKAPPQNPTTSYTATDQLGSPRVITNALGQVTSRRDFMPFGEEITPDTSYRTASLTYNTADNVRQKFTGYQKDDETGLDFAEARMYENRHGRFTAVDPLLASGKSADPQTFNRYVYTGNEPIRRVDHDGAEWFDVVTKIVEGKNTLIVHTPTWYPDNQPYPKGLSKWTEWSGYVYQATAGNQLWYALNEFDGRLTTWTTQEEAQNQVAAWEKSNDEAVKAASVSHGTFVLLEALMKMVGYGYIAYKEGQQACQDPMCQMAMLEAGMPPSVAAEEKIAAETEVADSTLAARANEIQSSLSSRTQSSTTTAVVATAEGPKIVASSERSLRPAQIASLNPDEIPVSGPGHAEATALNAAGVLNLTPTKVAASRYICDACALEIQKSGAIPITPLKNPL